MSRRSTTPSARFFQEFPRVIGTDIGNRHYQGNVTSHRDGAVSHGISPEEVKRESQGAGPCRGYSAIRETLRPHGNFH